MSKRTVTLKLTTQKDLVKHESSARTYGELKKELPNVKWSGMRVVERTNKTTLQMDDAVLPATDFVLFLVPEKVKSGASKAKGLKKLKNVETASYNDCRSHISFLNNMKDAKLAMDGGVDVLRARLKEYYDAAKAGKTPKGDGPVEIIEECRTKINNAIDAIIESAKAGFPVEDATEYVIKTSVADLDNELGEIKKSLKL